MDYVRLKEFTFRLSRDARALPETATRPNRTQAEILASRSYHLKKSLIDIACSASGANLDGKEALLMRALLGRVGVLNLWKVQWNSRSCCGNRN